jgi:hypothetical protein
MLTMVFLLMIENVSASQLLETGEEVEVKDQTVKMYIYESLAHSLVVDASDIYHKEYKAKSVKLL